MGTRGTGIAKSSSPISSQMHFDGSKHHITHKSGVCNRSFKNRFCSIFDSIFVLQAIQTIQHHVRTCKIPSSVKSDAEHRVWKFEMAKRPWMSRSMTPILNTNRQNKMHAWCKSGDSSSNPLQVIGCKGKPNFLEFSVNMVKICLKVSVNDSHIQHQTRVSDRSC